MPYFEVYQVKRGKFKGEWRWRLKAENGRIIATSGESFHNLDDCRSSISLVQTCAGAELRMAG